jgi:hypothetical protein
LPTIGGGMGVFYDFGFPAVESHEGYGARRLPSGELTGTWTHETRAFDAYVAACDCGWSGDHAHPPTEAGEDAAVDEWKRVHMLPLLPALARRAARRQTPRKVTAFEDEAVQGLPEAPEERAEVLRSLVAVASLGALAEEAEHALEKRVADARRAGAAWSALGDALGITKQAAQQRFGA